MSKAADFFNSGKPATPAAVARPAKPAATARDAELERQLAAVCQSEERLYKELLAALGRRGLSTISLPCEHCGGLSTVSIMRYPEVKMACRDAVAVWAKAFAEALANE